MRAGSNVMAASTAMTIVTDREGPTVRNTPSVANERPMNVSATVAAEPAITSPMVARAYTTASSEDMPLRRHSWYRLKRNTA